MCLCMKLRPIFSAINSLCSSNQRSKSTSTSTVLWFYESNVSIYGYFPPPLQFRLHTHWDTALTASTIVPFSAKLGRVVSNITNDLTRSWKRYLACLSFCLTRTISWPPIFFDPSVFYYQTEFSPTPTDFPLLPICAQQGHKNNDWGPKIGAALQDVDRSFHLVLEWYCRLLELKRPEMKTLCLSQLPQLKFLEGIT